MSFLQKIPASTGALPNDVVYVNQLANLAPSAAVLVGDHKILRIGVFGGAAGDYLTVRFGKFATMGQPTVTEHPIPTNSVEYVELGDNDSVAFLASVAAAGSAGLIVIASVVDKY